VLIATDLAKSLDSNPLWGGTYDIICYVVSQQSKFIKHGQFMNKSENIANYSSILKALILQSHNRLNTKVLPEERPFYQEIR
jgi:hypothetical protein